MTGTPSQIEWAELIRPRAAAEFDRVAQALTAKTGVDEILLILAEKRAEVLAREDAGYFIKEWQNINDQVRKILVADSRLQALLSTRRQQLSACFSPDA